MAIAYDEGKLIGVLMGTGGITDMVEAVLAACKKETGARVIYDQDPQRLIGQLLEDFVTYQKSLLLDAAYLQQDAFDPVDVSAPLQRQKETLHLIWHYLGREYLFSDKDEARGYFTRLTGLIKNLNYSLRESQEYTDFLRRI
ncbi:MAG: hypothetical protein KF861_21825, partial [Planctomycetaceae bacterium]|nr:hypothetical protein [Planctomycetaceae bacterium]